MTCDTFQIRISLNECLEDLVLLFVAGAERNIVLAISLAVVAFILPEMIGLDAKEHIHIRQALRAEIPCLLPGPEGASEIAVKADGQSFFLGDLQA